MKIAPKKPKFDEIRHGDVILTLQLRHESTCDQRAADERLFVYYLTHELVWVCELNEQNQ